MQVLRGRIHGDLPALEHDDPVHEGKKRVVTPTPDVPAGKKRRAALAHDDCAGGYLLAAISLDATKLGIGIATVACGTLSLFMCN